MSQKRTSYITWDEYFMSLVALSSIRSNYDINGACIIDSDKRILSLGYSDIPLGIKKYHNENSEEFAIAPLLNAIYNFSGRRQEFENGTLYLSSFPNYEEARQIAQAKIKKVVYLNKQVPKDVEEVSKRILECAKVEYQAYFDDKYSILEYKEFLRNLKNVMKKHIGKIPTDNLISEEYFMGIAVLSALRSKDPSTQVGACLVDNYDRVLSISYNGTPNGMSDDFLPWASFGEETGDLLTTKDPYIVHAEMNIFDNYKGFPEDLHKAKLYLIYSPCIACSKRISALEVAKVIYLREYTKNNMSEISKRWLDRSNTTSKLYNESKNYTKEECTIFLDEATKVIKKSLSKS